MKVRVLGSAAGGAFPQWNCNCSNCYGIRNGKIKASPRTQTSIAISLDNERWILLNVSPDIRIQLESFPEIQPQRGLRDTGIAAIVLMDSQIDHSTGLLMLREGCPLQVHATERVCEELTAGFPVFRVLESCNGGIHYQAIPVDGSAFQVAGIEALKMTAVPLTDTALPHLAQRHSTSVGANIGLLIEDVASNSSLFYAPGLGAVDAQVTTCMEKSDCLLVDGTFWREDEMIYAGVGTRLANEMGHLPLYGSGGMIEVLRPLVRQRKILIHINNTNPILVEDSAERAMLEQEGIEVSYDGMEILLGRHNADAAPRLSTVS